MLLVLLAGLKVLGVSIGVDEDVSSSSSSSSSQSLPHSRPNLRFRMEILHFDDDTTASSDEEILLLVLLRLVTATFVPGGGWGDAVTHRACCCVFFRLVLSLILDSCGGCSSTVVVGDVGDGDGGLSINIDVTRVDIFCGGGDYAVSTTGARGGNIYRI